MHAYLKNNIKKKLGLILNYSWNNETVFEIYNILFA